MAMCLMNYGFPVLDIEPGTRRETEVKLDRPFRPQKLHMVGFMDAIRGQFKIKRSRMTPLSRDDVYAYSRASRHASRRRTVVVFMDGERSFERTYRPESAVYQHTDPLSYIQLEQFQIGGDNTFPDVPDRGVAASLFGAGSFGNWLTMPSGDVSMRLVLWNTGDIRVKVCAVATGTGQR